MMKKIWIGIDIRLDIIKVIGRRQEQAFGLEWGMWIRIGRGIGSNEEQDQDNVGE